MIHRYPIIRLRKNGRLMLVKDGVVLNLSIVRDRRREPDLEPADNEYWLISDAELTRAAAERLRDQLDAWIKGQS